jgi:hypothetical protein
MLEQVFPDLGAANRPKAACVAFSASPSFVAVLDGVGWPERWD